MSELGITEDFNEIKTYSKYQLSKIVKSAYIEKSFNDLLMAQEKYSKGKELNYGKLQMRKYLTGNNMSREQAVLAFKFRVRLIKVKGNFQNSYINNMLCPVCALEDDLQVHLISCIPQNECHNH